MRSTPSIIEHAVDADRAVADGCALVARVQRDEETVTISRLDLGRFLVANRKRWPAKGPTARGWGNFLESIGVAQQRASEYMRLAGHVDSADRSITAGGDTPVAPAPSLREAGIKRDAPAKSPKAEPVRTTYDRSAGGGTGDAVDDAPDYDGDARQLDDADEPEESRDTATPPTTRPAWHCPACDDEIEAHQAHCAACNEHVSGAVAKCSSCGSSRADFVFAAAGRKPIAVSPTFARASSGAPQVHVAVGVSINGGPVQHATVSVPPAPSLDGGGHPIPAALVPTFAHLRRIFAPVLAALEAVEAARVTAYGELQNLVRSGVVPASDVGRAGMVLQDQGGHVRDLARTFADEVPHALCLSCRGTRQYKLQTRSGAIEMRRCDCAGWIGQLAWKSASKAKQAWLEEFVALELPPAGGATS